MNFSKYKLQEGVATSAGAMASVDTSQKGTQAATTGTQTAQTAKQMGNERTRRMRAQKADPRGAGQVFEDMQKKVEQLKAFESQKSDWRQELNEKVVDGQEREQHPYVTVMPTGDENLINAVKQMGKTVKGKKDAAVSEEVEQLDEKKKSKKCKEGYKKDENGNCVKKSSSKSRTTVVYGGRYPWMGGGHDHDEDDDSNGDGGGDAGGGEGGGMGEMFDALGDMLLKEKLETGAQYHQRMKNKNKSPINPYAVKKKAQINDKTRKKADITLDTRTDDEKMTDAVGKPRMGSSD